MCILPQMCWKSPEKTWYVFTCFPSRTNLKLHNISLTSKFVQKIISKPDLSKVPSSDRNPVVFLKHYECQPLYASADLFNVSGGIFFFQIVEISHRLWSIYLRMLLRGALQKNINLLVYFLRLVNSLKHLQATFCG